MNTDEKIDQVIRVMGSRGILIKDLEYDAYTLPTQKTQERLSMLINLQTKDKEYLRNLFDEG